MNANIPEKQHATFARPAAIPPDPPAPGGATPETARTFRYWQWRTILVSMTGYALFYFVRKNFSMAMPGMEADLGISKTSLGIFLTLNGLIYGLSRFVNGLFADRLNARFYLAIGLALCALSNFAFGFGVDIASLISGETSGPGFTNTLASFLGITWIVNGILQGSGAPPCMRLITHWVPPAQLATKMSVWNSSHSIGAGLVIILCGYIMGGARAGAWRWCFWIPAGISFCGAILLLIFLRDTPSDVGLPELGSAVVVKKRKEGMTAQHAAFLRKRVFGNPLIWLLGLANFFVYVVRFTVLDWGPTLLRQSKNVSLEHSGWLVALFEIVGIAGMLAAGWTTDRFMKGRAHRTCVFCMAGAALSAFIFWRIPAGAPVWMLFAALCGMGFFIYGPQALVGIAAINQATKKAAATAVGVVGIFGYLSTAVSGVGFGYIAQHHGWDAACIIVIVMAVAGACLLLLMWNAKTAGGKEEKDRRADGDPAH
jgi:OPA family glycerol-3-phosphate transporter-like MFS transporter/OPA family sugar phosphate sensor protein UhpC-like MFS transporter